jgi:hypothetical protein
MANPVVERDGHMKKMLRSALIAAAIGATVALALVIFGAVATADVPTGQVLMMLFAILCPPWEIFWAGIGEPQNVSLWVALSAAVVAANALLYVPAGLMHAATSHFKALPRFVVVAVTAVGSIGLGHLYFTP